MVKALQKVGMHSTIKVESIYWCNFKIKTVSRILVFRPVDIKYSDVSIASYCMVHINFRNLIHKITILVNVVNANKQVTKNSNKT